jgi:hypothetical protein
MGPLPVQVRPQIKPAVPMVFSVMERTTPGNEILDPNARRSQVARVAEVEPAVRSSRSDAFDARTRSIRKREFRSHHA